MEVAKLENRGTQKACTSSRLDLLPLGRWGPRYSGGSCCRGRRHCEEVVAAPATVVGTDGDGGVRWALEEDSPIHQAAKLEPSY